MATSNTAQLKKSVSPYEKPITKASLLQLINTIPPFILLWAAAYLSLSVSYWLSLPFILLASGFLIRIFILFHDCCHQSFFRSRKANEILGTLTGIMTLFPYHQWKHSHSIHHSTSSNLDKRGIGDMWLMTTDEYLEASRWTRFYYRLYRNPIVMFGIGPFAVFLIEYRFNRKGARRAERVNTWITNLGIVAVYGVLIWALGWQAFLLVQLPIFWLSGAAGIWLFYVQHQFEETYYEHDAEWSYVKAAVEGSSYYKLPKALQWLTGNIGFHHVHHLSPRVPNYLLEKAHESVPPLQHATTVTLKSSFAAVKFKLWDEQKKDFVTFGQIKHLLQASRTSASAAGRTPKAAPDNEVA
ncbi:fatty acid desaturase [Cohnella sp. LGH]|uniref:Omega-6 fatty acid desaturase (Delta-12 desaturase) n=1 Tax=Cohnella phaseoli TaxID=456490 RepID=A0A3D9IU17_9BACL|nr:MULTISPECIES: fatty acid desaturase [Cohnella]QTH45659.1 fatty acid desaturase [Cohnella sp. LGH]RED65195.1 omega-6 fatty acid desaturase (delta-12 desaturase) [Cohnella phaseoli]